jgi:hypothetical protein
MVSCSGMPDPSGDMKEASMPQLLTPSFSSEIQSTMSHPSATPLKCQRASLDPWSYTKTQKVIALLPASGKSLTFFPLASLKIIQKSDHDVFFFLKTKINSFCTARTVRHYFQTGELPKVGTVCSPERLPLDGFSEEEEPAIPKGETDEELWKAMVGVNK